MNLPDPKLEAVLNRLADGIATDADEQQLGEWLRSGPGARKMYREFMALHSALHWDYVVAAAPEPSPAPAPAARPWVPLFMMGRCAAFAAGALLATAVVWAVLRDDDQANGAGLPISQTAKGVAETHPAMPIAALLVNEVGAKFAEGLGPDGVRFGPGDYEILSGIVHLRFANGADMVLASPARLEIQDAQRTRLRYGRVRVTAPPSAKGFTISTRAADYIDLGTEFGLQVDRESGASDLYVFDGQVNVADSRSGKILSEVVGGRSSRFVDGAIGEAPERDETEFPTRGTIGFGRWKQYAETMRHDRGLVAFFPFRKEGDASVLTNVIGAAAMGDGRIVGARWTTGRWPGKDALLFDGDTDLVKIEIPGEYSELSIAAWVNIDRFDFVLNAILNSDGYDRGDIHFQLTRQGYPRGGVVINGGFQDQVTGRPVPLGEWVHVASVLATGTRTQQIYVNGVLARERTWMQDEILRPGSCRIGNWLPPADADPERRALRGRVDELAIWKRALPAKEIQQLVEAGRPDLTGNER
ncbi:hypothetical protein LBMAG56_42370 [Verrucomicrobiota bacterium]|nr:hypothetical protein LBMAG56_42370 [Verrucomicrobiota bacterium]